MPSMARMPSASGSVTRRACSGGGGAAVTTARCRGDDRALAVDRTAQTVEHAPEQMIGHADLERRTVRDDVGPGADAHQLAERHDQHFVVAEADRFGQHRLGRALI